MKWKNHFQYNKTERWGALVLVSLALGLWILPAFWQQQRGPIAIQLEVLEPEKPEEAQAIQAALVEPSLAHPQRDSLRPFDVNAVSAEELQAMGLSAAVAKRWCSFRQRLGGFKEAAQVKKIYGLSPQSFARLAPFLRFSNAGSRPFETHTASPAQPQQRANPNEASLEELIGLGLKRRQAEQLLRYREKGGSFRYKSDVKRLYSIDASTYAHIEAFIDLPEKRELTTLDINKAAAEDWQLLKGIGPSYAKRIVRFREALGGFHRVEQVGETFGLPDSTFRAIQPKLRCSAPPLQQLSINKASYEELKAHPYLSWSHAKAILRYREEQGAFTAVEQLQVLGAFDDGKNTFQKIKPYLGL